MKFTEEQFKQLVEIQEDQYSDDLYHEAKTSTKAIKHVVETYDQELHDFIDKIELENEAVALMNPLTRKWAHEQYVEKEKRYVWTSKKHTKSGYVHRLFKSTYDGVLLATVSPEAEIVEEEYLTESEIREWGYDPERFDKEEVE